MDPGRATLGSGPKATIRHTNAGWPVLAGTLVQSGLEAHLIVPGRVGRVTLRVGDEIRIGRADVALVGLLPAEAPPPKAGPDPASPLFGEYAGVERAPTPGLELAPALLRADAPVAAGSPSGSTPPPDPSTSASASAAAAGTSAAALAFGRRADFGSELYEQLRRTPWFMCSMALHVVLFLLLMMLTSQLESARSLGGAEGRLATILAPPQEQANTGPEPEDEAQAPEPLPPIDLLPDPEPVPEAENEPTPEAPQPTFATSLFPDEEPVPDLGTMPSLSSTGRRTAPKRVKPAPAPKVDLAQPVVKASARDSIRRAAEHVRDQLGIDRGGPGEALNRLKADDVLVIEGEFDHQERVLDALRIPYRMLSPHHPDVLTGAAFEHPRFVFWNCGHGHSPRGAARVAPHVRRYVEDGGYLFTSDWILGNLLKLAFPGYVDTGGLGSQLPELVLDIAPTRAGAGHPLLEGVFTPGVRGRWWLEQQSYDILVKNPSAVTVLIESPQLRELLNRSPAMAVTFAPGKGRVLHILGHYYQEEGNLAGVIAAQRIALNFVLLGLNAGR